jgi:Asp-tRNA(Asn)/Glu-tRNA(Gln) amidotransferase A subunit family amidase
MNHNNSFKEINDIYCLPAWKIAKLINNQQISANEVSRIFIKRIDLLNPKFKAWKFLNHDYAIDQAKWVDLNKKPMPLSGVPVGVKDVFNTEVFPTEMGSEAWKGHFAGNDARCVSYLKDKGGIIIGKTDTAEFAVHHPGDCLNPWDINRVTGTSSGGSAVAVATAMVPIALATQTAGSTIRPASWCGVYGMKPSFGLIPRTGVLKTTDTLDNIGFYGRDYQDLGLLLDSMRVKGANFPLMEKRLKQYVKSKKQWRIGFVKGHLWDQAPHYTQQSMLKMVNKFTKIDNVDIVEIDLPVATQKVHDLHHRIYDPCLAYYFRDELEKAPEKISSIFLSLVKRGRSYSPEDYKFALQEQSILSKKMEQCFLDNDIDLLIHHSSNGSAPEEEPENNLDLNVLWTMTWLPVINVPMFFCPSGLPYGLQFIGPRYSDYRMFDFLRLLSDEQVIPELARLAPAGGD